jgi:hypothetical protein
MSQNLTIISRQYLRHFIGNQLKIQLPYRELNVTKNSDICFEGYPRSANSWFHRYFSRANPNAQTAHHVHLCSQIKSALNKCVPTVVLIRNPLDCISSYHIYNYFETNLKLAIISYISYYNYIQKINSRILLVKFETAINDPEYIIRSLNTKFNLSFKIGDQKIVSQIKSEYKRETPRKGFSRTATPSHERIALKKKIIFPIENNLYYPKAKDIYNSLRKIAI